VKKLFFLLSGEHKTLPKSELKAILKAENQKYKIIEELDQVIRLETNPKCIKTIEKRAALTRTCNLELFTCKANINKIIENLRLTNIDETIKKGETFAVRIKRVKKHSQKINRMLLERKLGEIILNKKEKIKVNLKKPEKTFTGILTQEKFIFGLKIAEISTKQFTMRRPRKKPFFHPSAMQPKLARCMVNLTQPKPRELILDPFCGTGSILIEAALIGCKIIGTDIKKQMAKGTIKNLKHFKIKPEGIIIADAKNIPITKTDHVVTDPPYGRSSTTLKRTTKQIIEEALTAIQTPLKKGGKICIAAPKNVKIREIGEKLGYKHLESHYVYVHRTLTREIAVFEKV